MRNAFSDIHFHIDLPEVDLPKSFSILTAYNPLQKQLSEDENRAVNQALFEELFNLPQIFKVVLGDGASMRNSVPGFGCGARLHTMCNLAERWDQFGLYLVDGDKLSIVPCNTDSEEVIIPDGFRKRIIKSNFS